MAPPVFANLHQGPDNSAFVLEGQNGSRTIVFWKYCGSAIRHVCQIPVNIRCEIEDAPGRI